MKRIMDGCDKCGRLREINPVSGLCDECKNEALEDESEPAPDPMIEGEEYSTAQIFNGKAGYNKWMTELSAYEVGCIFDIMEEYANQFKPQPIVKGEGKWSDELEYALEEWKKEERDYFDENGNCYRKVIHYPGMEKMFKLIKLFEKEYKPTTSPEEEEPKEVKRVVITTFNHSREEDVVEYDDKYYKIVNSNNYEGWLVQKSICSEPPTPKPDGMQGEKDDINAAENYYNPSYWKYECENLQIIIGGLRKELAQFKAPDISEGEMNQFDLYLFENGFIKEDRKLMIASVKQYKEWLQSHPKAQQQAGEESEQLTAEEKMLYDAGFDKTIEVIRENAKLKSELQSLKEQPQAGKDESDAQNVRHGFITWKQYAIRLEEQLQTLRDNNSKLVDAIEGYKERIGSKYDPSNE